MDRGEGHSGGARGEFKGGGYVLAGRVLALGHEGPLVVRPVFGRGGNERIDVGHRERFEADVFALEGDGLDTRGAGRGFRRGPHRPCPVPGG